jgi:hypothetical protein
MRTAGSLRYLLNSSFGNLFCQKFAFGLISSKFDRSKHGTHSSGSGCPPAAICDVAVHIV